MRVRMAVERKRRWDLLVGAATALAFSIPLYRMKGFTVDDAWIPARYAAHLAGGLGYVFNAGGPSTDGVTPLLWAPMLAIVSGADVQKAWAAARVIGAAGVMISILAVGKYAYDLNGEEEKKPWRFVPLVGLLLSAPLAAWAVGGLETGVATCLATFAVVSPSKNLGGSIAGALCAGLAATFRPEMIVFAAIIGLARAFEVTDAQRPVPVLFSIGPWLGCWWYRLEHFGRGAPLALLAKPSDLSHGVAYAVAGTILAGGPILIAAPKVLAAPSLSHQRWTAIACFGHVFAILAAGGDWMPLSRLFVPIIPAMVVLAIDVANRAAPWATVARAVLASGAMLYAWARVGHDAAGVVETRSTLLQSASEILGTRRAIAALDVGWVGATTESPIVDLAGLTDPEIAALPGGHTSKQVPATLLDARRVDTMVFLRAPRDPNDQSHREDGGPFARQVEERIATDPWVKEHFETGAILRSFPLTYVVLTKKREARALPFTIVTEPTASASASAAPVPSASAPPAASSGP